ncbi:MAG TPA: DUF2793 domain-containing protein [Reyranella sp.]|nr:DUF2793 domain-containing protein [Reyranella sp.]
MRQAQKEFTVNEALLRADLAIQCAVDGERDDPPAAPVAGEAWLVGEAPSGAFAGHAGAIAGWSDAGWRFVEPATGLRVFDKDLGCFRHYDAGWSSPIAPPAPSGGTTVDTEARAALVNLVERLIEAGIFPAG